MNERNVAQMTERKVDRLVGRIEQICATYKFKDITEIFKLPLKNVETGEDLPIPEEYFIRTGLLSIFKNGYLKFEPSLEVNQSKITGGGLIELNKKYTEKIIENVVEVCITGFYPSLMINNKSEISTMIGHSEIYEEVYTTYKGFKGEEKKEEYAKKMKIYVNVTYGILASLSPNRIIKAAIDMASIPSRGRMIMQQILNEFEDHYVYVDTDAIWFLRYDEIKDRLNDHLNSVLEKNKYFGLETTKYDLGIFLSKKRYVLVDEHGNRIVKGLKTIS